MIRFLTIKDPVIIESANRYWRIGDKHKSQEYTLHFDQFRCNEKVAYSSKTKVIKFSTVSGEQRLCVRLTGVSSTDAHILMNSYINFVKRIKKVKPEERAVMVKYKSVKHPVIKELNLHNLLIEESNGNEFLIKYRSIKEITFFEECDKIKMIYNWGVNRLIITLKVDDEFFEIFKDSYTSYRAHIEELKQQQLNKEK